MRLIFRYIKKRKLLLFLNVIFAFSFIFAEIGIPFFFGRMIDTGINQRNPQAILSGFWIIVFVSVLSALGTLLLVVTCSKIATQAVYEIRKDLFEHVMKFSVREVEHFSISSLITRTNADAYQLMLFMQTLLRSALFAPAMLVVSLVLVFKTSISLSWTILVTLPIVVLGAFLIFKYSEPLSMRLQKLTDNINKILREDLNGIRVIRSFNRQKQEEVRFDQENRNYQGVSRRLFTMMRSAYPTFYFVMNIATLLIYYFGSLFISQNTLSLGSLVTFTEYLFHCMMSVFVLCDVFMMYPRASVSAKRIEEVLNMEPSIVSSSDQTLDSVSSIEFKNVSFAYPNSTEHSLHNVSFQAKKGQKVAIVGATGSGKSTLIRLINRFYDPTSGEILINGQNIQNYSLKSLRQNVAMISQRAHMFTGTIRDNVTFANPHATDEEIDRALSLSLSKNFVEAKPDQLEDWISEEGSNLSGGQKQRLSIARAICAKSNLYIFDDSFSALDLATDLKVRQSLAPMVKDSLFFIVAQRISTIMDCDQILLLDHGNLVACGTHDELYKTSELYRQIVLSQMNEQEALSYGRS
ncbi:MAG: ABC transporter ATP-binding protein [Erysipelotrichaceae bacterium]|nr:ABC transporter ATP-binding protein [Erysipelotrichaceae bacterium]